MTKRTTAINARCAEEKKQEYVELARAMGYDNFSEFLIAVLDSLNDQCREEGWESHLLHMSGPKVLATDAHQSDGLPFATAAFPVVAPSRFWKYLQENCGISVDDDSS